MPRSPFILCAVVLFCGCPRPSERLPDAGSPAACWPGFRAGASGEGCEPVLPASACLPGTLPVIGFEECQPVGPSACAAGFEPDLPSGWGCREIAAGAACTGATSPQLGQRDCRPVGDCDGAFPPAGATRFVDSSGPADATHFKTVTAALLAAGPGEVIAISPGTYVESLQPLQAVTLVGRCARDVVLDSPGGSTSGLRLRTVAVTLEGVTVRGMYTGAAVDSKGALTLRKVVLEANRELGATVSGVGSSLTVEDSVIRGTLNTTGYFGRGVQVQAGATAVIRRTAVTGNRSFGVFVDGAGSSVELSDSLVAATLPDATGKNGMGLLAGTGGSATVARCAFVGNGEWGVGFTGGRSRLADSVVRGTLPRADGSVGHGLVALSGAAVTVERSTFSSNTGLGLGADGQSTTLTVVDSVVQGTHANAKDSAGLTVRLGASLQLRGSALVGNANTSLLVNAATASVARTLLQETQESAGFEARALSVEDGACASFFELAVVDNSTLGALVKSAGCSVAFVRTLVSGTRSNAQGHRGWGLAVQQSSATLDESALVSSKEVGLFVYGNGAAAWVRHSAVTAVAGADGLAGLGLVGMAGTEARVLDSDVRGSGVGLAFNGGAGGVSGGFVSDNDVGLQAQNGSALEVLTELPAALGAGQVVVIESTRFEGNGTRIGGGVIPVPPVPSF